MVFALVAVVAGGALTVPFRDLWDPDETRYACVSREMLSSGDWLVPHLNGRPYPLKPPLYIWMEAGLRGLGLGWTPAGVLPSLVSFLAVLGLLPVLARRVGMSLGDGRLAAILLASSPLAVTFALAARMDMLLVLITTGSLIFLAGLLRLDGSRVVPRGWHLGFWLTLALGVLTKGPVAVAIPLLAAVSFALVNRPRQSLRPVFVGMGPLLAALVVAAWVVPAVLSGGPEYLQDILVRQTAQRLTGQRFAHPEPFHFYLVTYPLTGLPWSFLVILAATRSLRQRDDPGMTFLAATAASGFLMLSVISGKLVFYLLPLFPAALLLAAAHLSRAARGARGAVMAGAVVLTVVGFAAAIAPVWRGELSHGWRLVLMAGGAIALPSLVCAIRGARRQGLQAMVPMLVVAGLAFPTVTLPLAVAVMNPSMGAHWVGKRLLEHEPLATEVLMYRAEQNSVCLQAQRPSRTLVTEEELRAELARGRWVMLSEGQWHKLPADIVTASTVEGPVQYRRRRILLIHQRVPRPGADPTENPSPAPS